MRNLLVAQSGGPTSAINATIAGVIMEAHASDQVDTIYGAVNGIKGVLEERFVSLSEKVPGEDELEILCQTPAAALGSCRVKLKNPAEDDSQFQEIIRIFRKHKIMYFIFFIRISFLKINYYLYLLQFFLKYTKNVYIIKNLFLKIL